MAKKQKQTTLRELKLFSGNTVTGVSFL